MELYFGSFTACNPAAEFQQHEECSHFDDNQESKFYAESIDSSTSEHSDVASPEVATSCAISCPAYGSESHDASNSD